MEKHIRKITKKNFNVFYSQSSTNYSIMNEKVIIIKPFDMYIYNFLFGFNLQI